MSETLCAVQTLGPTRSLLSKGCFDKSLPGISAEEESSPSPHVPCSATKWEECEHGFHLSLETSLIWISGSLFVSPLFWILSWWCWGAAAGNAPTRKRRYRSCSASHIEKGGGRCSAERMGLTQMLVEEGDSCVCTERQKNLALWYKFGDLLKNPNKLLCVKQYCSPLLHYSYFFRTASSWKELTAVGRSARLLHGDIKQSCIYHDCDQCFVFKVKVGNEITTGTGPNKKIAKRNAAEAMLLQLGYKASTPLQDQPEKVRTNCYDGHILLFSRFLAVSANCLVRMEA